MVQYAAGRGSSAPAFVITSQNNEKTEPFGAAFGILRWGSVFEAVDVFEGAGDDDVVVFAEDVVAWGEDDGRVALLDGKDVDAVFLAHIGFDDVFAHPFAGDFDFEHAVIRAEFDEVEDVVGIEAESFWFEKTASRVEPNGWKYIQGLSRGTDKENNQKSQSALRRRRRENTVLLGVDGVVKTKKLEKK